MGKGGKKASKHVKQEKQENTKQAENEQVVPNARPSPIPEEVEIGFAGSVHGDQGPTDHCADAHSAPEIWHASSHLSRTASPRTGDHRSILNTSAPGSQTGKSESPSLDQRSSRYRSSPYPNRTSVDLHGGDFISNEESELDYVSDEQPGQNPNMHEQWDTVAQDRSQAESPQEQTGQRMPQATSGPTFPIYATSLSNPPIAPNPLPAPPNVLSKASDAAARLHKSRHGDLPSQISSVPPLPPAAWQAWARPDTYKRRPTPPLAPPQAPHPAPVSEAGSSIPRGPNTSRGIWDLKHGKGIPDSAYQPRGRGTGQWHQRPSVADAWAAPHGKGGYDAWIDNGLGQAVETGYRENDMSRKRQGMSRNDAWTDGGWGRTDDSDRQNDGDKKGHGRTKTDAWNDGGWGQTGDGGWHGNDRDKKGHRRTKTDTWNDGGWGQPGDGGWHGNDGDKKGHGRTQTDAWNDGGWAQRGRSDLYGNDGGKKGQTKDGKRYVQWEEESSTDDTEDDDEEDREENGWGEHDGGEWKQADSKTWDHWNQGGNVLGHQSSSMHNWGEGRRGRHAVDVPSSPAGTRAAVSTQQHSQILNSLLNMSDLKHRGQAAQPEQRSNALGSKHVKKEGRRQTQYNAGWGLEDESWGNVHDEDDDENGDDIGFRAHSSKRTSTAWDAWGGSQGASRYSMPSLTLAHAYKDMKTRLDPGSQNKLDDLTKMRFYETSRSALAPTKNAFFGNTRLARDRIHWNFPPDKDERVRAALIWVQEMSYGLGTFGVHKFLQSRERGALVINADYRIPDKPTEFAVDYLTFDELQRSKDHTLQVSVISYDPTTTVIVFIFLPSKTGNSIAIWRRKLPVPNNVRLRFQTELGIALAGLSDPKSYVVHVDEIPKAKEKKGLPNLPQTKPKKKRKWWQFYKWFKS